MTMCQWVVQVMNADVRGRTLNVVVFETLVPHFCEEFESRQELRNLSCETAIKLANRRQWFH